MDVTLSKRGDYVMRSAISLARAYGGGASRKIRELVADTEVPQTFASQILADLVRAGLATSKAGRYGGYRLSRPPSEITVLEVIEAAEGRLHADRCALGEGPCRWEAVCPLHETWSEVTMVLRELLTRTSLDEVATRDIAIEAGRYAVPADSHRSHPSAVTLSDAVHVELAEADVHVALAGLARDVGAFAEGVDWARSPGNDTAGVSRRQSGDRPAAEASLVPVGDISASEDGDASRYLLAWRIEDPERAIRFEGDLSVAAVDPERSQVRVEGTWHEGKAADARLTASELEREVHRTLRIFLRWLAWSLEKPAGSGRGRPRPRSTTSR